MQLTLSGTSLTGTLDVADLKNGTAVDTQHRSFNGSKSGQDITLTFNEGLGVVTNVSGAIDNDTVALNFPQGNGTIQSTTFALSDSSSYNTALHQLQQQASEAQASQAATAQASQEAQAAADQQAQTSQSAADQQARLDSAVVGAAQNVSAAIGRVQGDNFGPTSLNHDLQTQQSDLTTMRNDEAKARTEADPSTRCADASTVQADASTIAADYSSLQADQSSVSATVQGFQGDIDAANGAYVVLQQAQQTDPTYGGTLPAQSDVAGAVTPLQSAINTNTKAAKSAVEQANQVLGSATAEAAAFVKQYCS